MSIQETKDGRWRVQVDMGLTLHGKRARRVKTCRTKSEAKKLEAALMVEREMNGGLASRTSLGSFIDDVFAPNKRKIVRANTWRGYERDIRLRIKPALGRMEVSEIKKLHVQRMISSCGTYKVAKNARDTLHTILQMAVDLEIVPRNVASGKFIYPEKIKTDKDKAHGDWLTSFAEHVAVINAAKGSEVYPIIVLGLCFGLRGGEILGMDWEQVDFAAKEIHVRQTYTHTKGAPDLTAPKTRGSVRDVPMTDYAETLLRGLRSAGGAVRVMGPVVSYNGERMTPNHARKAVASFRASHNLPDITIMSLRHSFATAAVRSGVNVASLSKWLGHADVSTTLNRYVRPLQSDLHEDAVMIDEAYRRAAGGE